MKLVDAALRAGAAVAGLLAEVAGASYFVLRKMVNAVIKATGPFGEILDWALTRLESFAEDVFHSVLTAARYAGAKLTEALDWVVDKGTQAIKAMVNAWESVRERLIDLYRWASEQAQQIAEVIWEEIGRATQRFRNSVVYVLLYLERDFIPGVRRFVTGLLDAGYEVTVLVGRLARRGVQLVAEAVAAMLAFGVTLTELIVATVRRPRSIRDNLVAAYRAAGQTVAQIVAAAEAAGEDALAEILATLDRLQEPLEEMLAGAAEVGGGALATVVSILLNWLATYRPLTEEEKAAGRLVFGNSIDLDNVSISAESLDNKVIFAIQNYFDGDPDSRAFVTTTLINFDVSQGIDTPTLVHELTHVWQAEVTGPFYMAEAIHAQVIDPDAYNYGYTNATNGNGGEEALDAADGDLNQFNREQQGDIAMHYYVRRHEEGRDEPEWAPWQPYVDVFQAA